MLKRCPFKRASFLVSCLALSWAKQQQQTGHLPQQRTTFQQLRNCHLRQPFGRRPFLTHQALHTCGFSKNIPADGLCVVPSHPKRVPKPDLVQSTACEHDDHLPFGHGAQESSFGKPDTVKQLTWESGLTQACLNASVSLCKHCLGCFAREEKKVCQSSQCAQLFVSTCVACSCPHFSCCSTVMGPAVPLLERTQQLKGCKTAMGSCLPSSDRLALSIASRQRWQCERASLPCSTHHYDFRSWLRYHMVVLKSARRVRETPANFGVPSGYFEVRQPFSLPWKWQENYAGEELLIPVLDISSRTISELFMRVT